MIIAPESDHCALEWQIERKVRRGIIVELHGKRRRSRRGKETGTGRTFPINPPKPRMSLDDLAPIITQW